MQNEEWKAIPQTGLEQFEISTLGNIRKFDYKINQYVEPSTHISSEGHERLSVYANGKQHVYSIYKLAFLTFKTTDKERIEEFPLMYKGSYLPIIVQHQDGDKTNNSIDNIVRSKNQFDLITYPTLDEHEVWKNMDFCDELKGYRVSSLGNIQRFCSEKSKWEHMVRFKYDSNVITVINRTPYIIFKLLLQTFLGIEQGHINYRIIDGNIMNLRLSNIEYIPPKDKYKPELCADLEGEIWKPIPVITDLKDYLASNLGRVKKFNHKHGYYVLCNQHRDTNGYRRIVRCVNSVSRYYSVHRLVALAFLPYDHLEQKECHKNSLDGIGLVPNHKDGNKIDNRVENLVWTDNEGNSRHAQENRLIKTSYPVNVLDLTTGKTSHYNSITEVSVALNLGSNAKPIIFNTTMDNPYMGRYVFTVDEKEYVRNHNKTNSKPIMVYDYVTKTITIYELMMEVERVTGVIANTIKSRAKIDPNKRPNNLIAGYEFYYVSDFDKDRPFEWRDFTSDEAKESRDFYHKCIQNGTNMFSKETEVMNVATRTVEVFQSLKQAAKKYGLDYPGLKQVVRKNRNPDIPLRVYQGYIFRQTGDNRDWLYCK